MARPLNDSPYLYGLHDAGGESIMADLKVPGWILFTEELGSDPGNTRGVDYSRFSKLGFGIMARLNNGYEPNGTLPVSKRYVDFATRCANFVRNSPGCHIWIIGNETNFAVERPGVRIDWSQNPPKLVEPGEVILPSMYATCYKLCRAAIKALAGHATDQVIVSATAPWNVQTTYDGNPSGDWIRYFSDTLGAIGAPACDGISIHAYTHGSDPALIYTDSHMNPPFEKRQFNFRAYQDFMHTIPADMRSLPVYLTETDQNDEWRNENKGWVQRAYGEINAWNKVPENQKIRAVILFRWPKGLDRWGIEGKTGVIEDFRAAIAYKYNWETAPKPAPTDDTSPILFPDTGKTARAPFVVFYRKYGAEITGSPITDEYTDAQSKLKTQDWQRVIMEEYPAGKVRLRPVGQELADLRVRISLLEKRIAELTARVGGLMEPPLTDISASLPHGPTGFIKRPLEAIQYLLIHHTAVRPEVGAERVAQAQLAKWPGIISQYYITGDGHIQRTNPDDAVASRDVAWLYNGLGIYVAGNFDATVPSAAQMDALANLCAWLLFKYQLPTDALRGASEVFSTRSPGQQWLMGQRWKDALLERVRAIADGRAGSGTRDAGVDPALLRAEVKGLQVAAQNTRTHLVAVEARNALLLAQIAHFDSSRSGGVDTAAGPIPPDIEVVIDRLPFSPDSYKPRGRDQINYLVFSHTAVDPSVGADRMAASHQKRWGGILYQYFVTGEGEIQQTSPIDQVVDLEQSWIAEGINIAVAGNFTLQVPSDTQLKAAARLCAWLMRDFEIPPENVRGVSEFITSKSPGIQWLEGRQWKNLLLAEIAAETGRAGSSEPVLTRASGISAGQAETIETVTAQRDDLAQQVTALKAGKVVLGEQLLVALQAKAELERQVAELEARTQALQAATDGALPAEPGQAAATQLAQIPAPAITDVVDRLPKNPTLQYETRPLSAITHLAIHHSAAPANITPEQVATYHVRNAGWPGIGYHFYVEPDGTIYQTNRLETKSYHVGNSNSYAVGICVSGRFTGVIPTPNQIAQTGQLSAWLAQKLNIPSQNIIGHREFPNNHTECPGNDWLGGQQWKQILLARVREVAAGSQNTQTKVLGHYVLFWQRPDAWAKADWEAAESYFARFRPTAGFSVDDARQAEYVTIVGGANGVSLAVEQALRSSGSKVDRLTGTDADDLKRILDELARTGRRFRTFEY